MSRSPALDDHLQRALAAIGSRGVEVRSWPDPAPRAPGAASRPVLHIVAAGADPPPYRALHNWVRAPFDLEELYGRADQLLNEARPLGPVMVTVEDQVLRVDDAVVVLSPLEERVLLPLVDDLGALVTRARVEGAGWPDGPAGPARLGQVITAIRRRLVGLPLRLHTVRAQGFVLERVPPAS